MSNNSGCEFKRCPMNFTGPHVFINSKNRKMQYCKLCGCMRANKNAFTNNTTRNKKVPKIVNMFPKIVNGRGRKSTRKNSRK